MEAHEPSVGGNVVVCCWSLRTNKPCPIAEQRWRAHFLCLVIDGSFWHCGSVPNNSWLEGNLMCHII
ncbi:hypothetical protein PanWU01x14_004990 [Parasponia andersonii]|uniref:Uncharacterized protein n=1 Tax=Parasponia andersonii TaxID=3476 RepID=A0A2P5E3D3_PARAD|nr:hypothetical protein PanWU01x14_004990 [Parasponia andersonii]